MKWVTASALLVASAAQAVDCPRLIGLNASNVLEYCDANNVHHFMALSDSIGAPTPVATYAYTAPTPRPTDTPMTAPTPQPTYAYTVPTAIPTYAYTAPTPLPTATRVPVVAPTYAPVSLAANASRCDTLTITGIVTGRPVIASPGVSPATGCVIAGVWASGANTVTVCWRNAFAATTACQTPSSTWTFVQP